ncbi:hypothetical protein GOODEAATRI_027077 [Goodea atripinnis]|uniref:Secreted protein n=1 Tax=Goodea atripinnis TaxID=208336 RepID=A0ABV0Q258_9TELE
MCLLITAEPSAVGCSRVALVLHRRFKARACKRSGSSGTRILGSRSEHLQWRRAVSQQTWTRTMSPHRVLRASRSVGFGFLASRQRFRSFCVFCSPVHFN